MALLKDHGEIWMTGEELLRRPDLEPCELIDGRVVPRMPTGNKHADLESELNMRLRLYGKESKRGRAVGGEAGIYIRRNPDTVRAADVAFISKERDLQPEAMGFLEVAPELVVEILSPDHRSGRLDEKLRDYFSAGVQVVWVVDPEKRRVLIHRSPSDVAVLDERQSLTDEELLPGFSLPLSELFPS
ncbi:MAG: Uma2 family endonuclease [Thermoanaerobaculia bacterium]